MLHLLKNLKWDSKSVSSPQITETPSIYGRLTGFLLLQQQSQMEEEVSHFCEHARKIDKTKDEGQAALTDNGLQPPVTASMIYPEWNTTAPFSVARWNTHLPLHSYIT